MNEALYLYLTKPEWAEAWVQGGSVPISPASKYLSAQRSGTSTPDEVVQRYVDGTVDSAGMDMAQSFVRGLRGMSFKDCTVVGPDGRAGVITSAEYVYEDALVLCFSRSLSRRLMERLGKAAVVALGDLDLLKRSLDEQIGSEGRYGAVQYTKSADRGHVLKGWDDRWQAEARFWWPQRDCREVVVSVAGGAKLLALADVPEDDGFVEAAGYERYDELKAAPSPLLSSRERYPAFHEAWDRMVSGKS